MGGGLLPRQLHALFAPPSDDAAHASHFCFLSVARTRVGGRAAEGALVAYEVCGLLFIEPTIHAMQPVGFVFLIEGGKEGGGCGGLVAVPASILLDCCCMQ